MAYDLLDLNGVMQAMLQVKSRNASQGRRSASYFSLAHVGHTTYCLRPFSRSSLRRKKSVYMANGINILLTPMSIPRVDKSEGHVSGCAASGNYIYNHHLFLDWRERSGHDYCDKLSRLRPANFAHVGGKKITSSGTCGCRYWDFRDCTDVRTDPDLPAYETVREFIYKKLNETEELSEETKRMLFGYANDIDDILPILAARPDLGRGWIDSGLLPTKPLDGILRTQCWTQPDGIDKNVRYIVDEAFVINASTLQSL